MFGFKPMVTRLPVTISSDGMEPVRYNSMSQASISTGIPYTTLLYACRNSKQQVHSNGQRFMIVYN